MADRSDTADRPPPNWLRRQCPACGLWVTGLLEEGKTVAKHPCGEKWVQKLEDIGRRITNAR